jgi:nicotinamidase-related amidase
MIDVSLRPDRTALLFFDCLKAYLRPEDPEKRAAVDASGLIPALQKIERACRANGILIFYTQIEHRPDLSDVAQQLVDWDYDGRRGERPFVAGDTLATPGTWKTEIIDEIAPQPEDIIIRKQRWNAFFETNFWLHLRRHRIEHLLFAGGNTDIGVASTAYAARDRDFNLVFLKDALRSRREGVSEFLLERVFPVFSRVMTVDAAIELMKPPASRG